MKTIRLKHCTRCGGDWDEEAFYRKRNHPNSKLSTLGLVDYHPVCIGCELTDRNDPTPEERARRKAINCIATHAEKYRMTPSEFARRYGWEIERMIYDIMHGHENTCTYCWERYDVMGHGLSDITLDVVDPQREPYYRVNVKWCCTTCNREKSAMPPELWNRRLIVWPQYMKWRNQVKENATHGLPLFGQRSLFS